MSEEEFITQLKGVVLSHDDKAQVILFGSRARGDFKADSDWDILVLTSEKMDAPTQGEMIDDVYEMEMKYLQPISTLIIEKKRWDQGEIMPLHKNVTREGIVL